MKQNALFNSETAAAYCKGIHIGENVAITNVVIDSREAREGSLFVALRGERQDGNAYIGKAAENGAACVLSQREPEGSSGIVVPDTLLALQQIARRYKESIKPFVVAVTGSVGKTTTKEFIASVLSRHAKTQKTQGNYNSVIGLPLTLLQLQRDTENIVLEMGMSYAGEIKTMSEIARPDIGVITNVGVSHMENLGSRENILRAKLEITAGMKEGAALILNGDDPRLFREKPYLSKKFRVIYAAVYNEEADYVAKNISFGDDALSFDMLERESGRVISGVGAPVIGMHNVYNAMIAYICGQLCGMTDGAMREGLAGFQNTGNRQRIYETRGVTVIADCYNAAPESMRASVSVLSALADKRHVNSFAVLGDMKELGEAGAEMHREVGRTVYENNITHLITYGEAAREIARGAIDAGMPADAVTLFSEETSPEEIAKALWCRVQKNDILLFKASRAMALERVAAAFERQQTE